MENKIKDRSFAILFFLFVLVILNIAYSALVNITVREEKTSYKYIAINEANYISSCIDKVVVRTYTIREMVYENDGGTEFFDKVADTIQQSVKTDTGIALRNIAVAPDGVVTKVLPLENNENLIGFNFTDESRPGNKDAIEAYKRDHTIITNPFELVQGGMGISARTPVFINNGNKREYWGLVSVTVDFDDVLRAFNFENFTNMHMKYRLWYEDEAGEAVFLSGSKEPLKDCVTEEVKVFNLKWNLDVLPENDWKDKNLQTLARLAIIVVSMLLTTLILLVLRIKRDGSMMRVLAEQDSLTHCYSRHYLNSQLLNIQSGDWSHPENNYSMAIIDVDKFKHINDEYGHVVGDRALMAIAKILNESILNPKKDRVVRFGGDEFIVFYSNIERKDLRIKFQDILSAVEKIHFDDIPELKLTISAGIAIPEKMENRSYKEMMKRADENLYKVKENGRNNYVME